jgi:hypothetical protein
MSGFETIEGSGAPIKAWTRGVPIEDATMTQLRNVASLPFIHSHVAVMPDVHWGMGATVGSVIPTVGAIIPAAVGVDIGCGMMAVRTSIRAPTSLRPPLSVRPCGTAASMAPGPGILRPRRSASGPSLKLVTPPWSISTPRPRIRAALATSVRSATAAIGASRHYRPNSRQGSRENLHLIERWTRMGPTSLEYVATIEDPTVWTRPWTVKQEFTRQSDEANRLYTEPRYVEGNYGRPGLMRGARAEEIAYKEGRGPHPATKDNATDFVGVEDDPLR